ncbi:MAG TPA: hypothetical protein ENK08_09860 [Chloroflexi bacterium]|nr:hypothetical protein [Chloroflexota bacterium]
MHADRQMHEASLRQLRSLLEAQTRLRKAAEAMAEEARRELERVAEALCPEEVDRLRLSSASGLAVLSPRQIADLVIRQAARRRPSGAERGLEARVADLEDRLRAALARATQAEAEVAALRARSAPDGPSPPSSDEHRRALVQRAANLLTRAGYDVERTPAPVPLPDGTAFQPDLMLREGDRRVPVEVEDLTRPPEEREARWEACYRIAQGDLRFVAPDPRTLDRVRSEVFFWLGPRPFFLRMTHLSCGRGLRGEAVWLVRREAR